METPERPAPADQHEQGREDVAAALTTAKPSPVRRRIAFYLLVVGIGVIVVRYASRQPCAVTVSYDLGDAREGLRGLDLSYRRDGEELWRVSFSYEHRPAPSQERHSVRLPEGDYRVDLTLRYRGVPPLLNRKRIQRAAPDTLLCSRPLLVRGSGPVTIFIDDR